MLKKNSSQMAPSRLPLLTSDNYYQDDTYMDVSSFKPFLQCEAAAYAKYHDQYKPSKPKSGSNPLIFGNFIHSYFESDESHKAFLQKPDVIDEMHIHKSNGEVTAKLKQAYSEDGLANRMIKTLEDEPLFDDLYMPGDKEVIVTGEINGFAWKGKIDSLNLERGYFCDLKTVDDLLKKHWIEGKHYPVSFAEERGYFMQIALYQELIYQNYNKWLQPFIFAVSKQDVPDHDLYDFDTDEIRENLDEQIETIKDKQQRVFDVIKGNVKPTRCEHCEYCRATKKLTGSTHITDIELR